MKKVVLFLSLILIIGCENQSQKKEVKENKITTIQTNDYELIKSSESKALLIIFPGGCLVKSIGTRKGNLEDANY